MGAGSSVRRRASLPIATSQLAPPRGLVEDETHDTDGAGHETQEAAEEYEDGNPRTRSMLLNHAMTEALQRNDVGACAALGRQLMEVPVEWIVQGNGENAGLVHLSTLDKPNRAVLAAVCGVKASGLQRRGLCDDAQYVRKLATMFASSLGPAECFSKATVDSALDAYALRMRNGRERGRRRQSS